MDKIRDQVGKRIGQSFRITILDCDGLSFDVTELTQTLAEGLDAARIR
jgi:hypothetical protein